MVTLAGEKVRTERGLALRYEREYRAGIDEVWSALTDPERTHRWLGELRMSGDTGRLVQGDEDEGEYAELRVVGCEPPYRIEVDWTFPGAALTHVLVTLAGAGAGRTLVVLLHTFPAVTDPADLAGYGCGWQHYVDSLAAHLASTELPAWADYYPALLDEWRALVPSGGYESSSV
jgi:uncharacterized protein YndB with AHSA1/START domain